MSSGKWLPFCLGLNVLRLSCDKGKAKGDAESLAEYYALSMDTEGGKMWASADFNAGNCFQMGCPLVFG